MVEGSAESIVYTNLITGVHGNYLKPSLIAAGLDPDNLPQSDAVDDGFRPGGKQAWKDIWGSGQGIGAIERRGSGGALVERLAANTARARRVLRLSAA